MKKISSFLVITFMLLALHAQKKATDANVMGHVVCSKTGEHIPYANILAKGTTIGFSSDHSGHFFVQNLTPRTYIFRVRELGHKEVEQTVELIAGVTKEMNISLDPTSLDLDEVVISSSRKEKRLRLNYNPYIAKWAGEENFISIKKYLSKIL